MRCNQYLRSAVLMTVLTTVALAALPTAAQTLDYTEEFGNANGSLSSVGWNVYLIDNSGSVNDLSTSTAEPTFIAPDEYAFTAPRMAGAYNAANGPGLMFTTEPTSVLDSTNLGLISSLSVDVNADGSGGDPALGRFAIQIGGQWYASDITTTSTTNDGPTGAFPTFSTPAMFDFQDGNNWLLMTIATGAGGEITVGGSPVGGTLSGNVDAFGIYAENGNAGDHFRIDNFAISTTAAAVPEPASMAIWGMIGTGLLGVGCFRARRRK